MEESQVTFGTTRIDYRVQRGRRQKTVAVGVDAVEGVHVRAPQDTPISKLDEIVRRKAPWIVERQRRHEDLPPSPAPRKFVSGETFLYLGRQHRLKVVAEPRVRLVAGRLRVPSTEPRRSLESWYRESAARRVPGRVELWQAKLRLIPKSVLIRDQRKRWGSADTAGNLRFNWRIIQAPQRLIDYVVAHELVHLRYPDHTRDFWADLGMVMPDYEARREELRRIGRLLVW